MPDKKLKSRTVRTKVAGRFILTSFLAAILRTKLILILALKLTVRPTAEFVLTLTMDNLSIFYREEYRIAKALKEEGKSDECLDILWKLRLEPDISLYRRALVNLLIATTADIQQHPDISKFAHESIDLVDQIRRDSFHNNDKVSEYALSRIEASAHKNLSAIKRMFQKMQDEDKKRGVQREVGDQEQEQGSRQAPEQQPKGQRKEEKDEGSISNWTIEGMYTDHGFGYGYGPDGAKTEVGREKAIKKAVSQAGKKAVSGPSLDPAPVTPHGKLPGHIRGDLTGQTIVAESPQSTVKGTPRKTIKDLKDT